MLSEMLIVCTMMVFVLSAAWLAFTTVTYNMSTISQQSMLSNDTNNVMDKFTREIRQAQEVSNGGGVFATVPSGNDMSFYSNIDAVGEPELIRYYRENNILFRSVNGGVATGVIANLSVNTEPMFRYYTNTSPAQEVTVPTLDTVNSISMVSVSMKTSDGTVSHVGGTKIKIRCMFNSLN